MCDNLREMGRAVDAFDRVCDRFGYDRRHAIDSSKLSRSGIDGEHQPWCPENQTGLDEDMA